MTGKSSYNHIRYYDLEDYLFEDVSARFRSDGEIGAFDFFSIVIWKANRAKSMTAKRLLHLGAGHGLRDLEAICRHVSRCVRAAETDEARFAVLITDWKFALPMASAILSVFYPERFSVYDYRVCDVLGDFAGLAWTTDFTRLWRGYNDFIDIVRTTPYGNCLRDKDRYLTGQSTSTQLVNDITNWSTSGYFNGR